MNPGVFAEPRDSAVAIDSVDGAPAQVTQKFARDLGEAASAHQITVMPRGAAAPFRLRGYLAVRSRGSETAIAWAWDIYDTTERRAFRLGGEETAEPGRKSWAAVDDEVLGRVARASVEQLASFLADTHPQAGSAPSSPFAEKGHALLSQLDDFAPEASGIFRILANKPAPSDAGTAETDASSASVPLPPDRPAPPTGSSALAFTDDAQ